MGAMRCPTCGGRLMYRTRITIDPYAVSSAWVCPACEQQKTAPKAAEESLMNDERQSSNKQLENEL